MKIHRLRDVNPLAISLVEKGANRKRFFMRKADGAIVDDPVAANAITADKIAASTVGYAGLERLIELPRSRALIHKADWSVVYCVVAEPGARENPGQGAAEPDVDDEWASADEIAKAAHRFMANGALVNKAHETLEPYGELVENFIAPADLTVEGETITKGSWVVGIKPSDEGRAAIEAGTFTGVSLQGSGVRDAVEVEKATVKVNIKEPKMSKLLTAIAKAVGLDPEDPSLLEAEVAISKARTFGNIIAERELEENLPTAQSALREAIYCAFYPSTYDGDPPSPEETRGDLETSLSQFGDHMLMLFDEAKGAQSLTKSEALAMEAATLMEMAKADGADATQPQEDVMDADTKTALDALDAKVESVTKAVGDLADAVKPIADTIAKAQADAAAAKAPTAEELGESIAKVAEQVATIAKGVEKLGEGESTQPGGGDVTVTKSADNPLAGLLA